MLGIDPRELGFLNPPPGVTVGGASPLREEGSTSVDRRAFLGDTISVATAAGLPAPVANLSRDKALYMSWLADSYLIADEVEEAARVTGRALGLAAGVASVHSRQRLDPVLDRLRAPQGSPVVREVLEKAI